MGIEELIRWGATLTSNLVLLLPSTFIFNAFIITPTLHSILYHFWIQMPNDFSLWYLVCLVI